MHVELDELIGSGFEEAFDFNYLCHFLIAQEGKDCKKSNTFNGFFVLLHILQNKNHNAVLVRNELKLHEESTLKDFKFALAKFSEVTNYDWAKHFHIVQTPFFRTLPLVMNDGGTRIIIIRVSGLCNAVGEIDILPVHKKGLIQ